MTSSPKLPTSKIAILGHIDVDPDVRDALVASTTDLQRATQTDEPGCMIYSMAADPAVPGRIRIVELWESAEALDAHFQHPNFHRTGEALRAEPRLGGAVQKYRIDAVDGIRGADGTATAAFAQDLAEVHDDAVNAVDPADAADAIDPPEAVDAAPASDYVQSYEDVSVFALDGDRERTLLDAQTECTFMWTTDSGAPVGVIMNYIVHEGRFWITCTRRRKRVAAVEARPRVAIAVSSRGTDIGISQTVTYQGTATVHDDAAVKAWFYPALAAKVRPDNTDQQRAFVHHLDTDGRVVIEIAPSGRIGFDADRMFENSPAGRSRTKV